jgi:F0F1-type ATP synthase membrane subunit b/b'
MAWFEKEMNYAKDSLAEVSQQAIERAGDKLTTVVRDGVAQAGQELREVIQHAGEEIDAKLDKISLELHNQRQFTKDDVKEMVDYAADRLSTVLDERVAVAKREISVLVEDKVEFFKQEVDDFFIRRQHDLARERRRLFINVLIAVSASFLVGGVSWLYHRFMGGTLDIFGIFRIVFASLMGGYAVYLGIALIRRWMRMSEHRKDALYLTMRYWGVLRPESIFMNLVLLCLAALLFGLLLFPEVLSQLPGGKVLMQWVHDALPALRRP